MKRHSAGVWTCKRCRKTVAGGAFVFRYSKFYILCLAKRVLSCIYLCFCNKFWRIWDCDLECTLVEVYFSMGSGSVINIIFWDWKEPGKMLKAQEILPWSVWQPCYYIISTRKHWHLYLRFSVGGNLMYGIIYYFVSLQYLGSSHSKECRASFTRS